MEILWEVLESVHEALDEVGVIPESVVRLTTVRVNTVSAIIGGRIFMSCGTWIFSRLRVVFNFRGLLIFTSCGIRKLGRKKCKHNTKVK